jgi:hypothetical protein
MTKKSAVVSVGRQTYTAKLIGLFLRKRQKLQCLMYCENAKSVYILLLQVRPQEDSDGFSGPADLAGRDHGFLSVVRAVPHPPVFPRLHLC